MSTSTDYYLVYLKYWFKTQEKYLDFATWLNLHRSISFWKPCVPGLLGVCIVLIRTYWSPHCVSQWTVSQQSRYNYWFQILNQQAIKFQWVSPPIFTGVWWGDSQGWRARDRSCEISLYLPLLLQRFPSSSFSNPPNTRHQEPSISSLVNAHCRNVNQKHLAAQTHLVKEIGLIGAIYMFILSKNGCLLSTIMQNIRQRNFCVSDDVCLSGPIRTGRVKRDLLVIIIIHQTDGGMLSHSFRGKYNTLAHFDYHPQFWINLDLILTIDLFLLFHDHYFVTYSIQW